MLLRLAGALDDDVALAVAHAASSAAASRDLAGRLEALGVIDMPGPHNPLCAYSSRCAAAASLSPCSCSKSRTPSCGGCPPCKCAGCVATAARPQRSHLLLACHPRQCAVQAHRRAAQALGPGCGWRGPHTAAGREAGPACGHAGHPGRRGGAGPLAALRHQVRARQRTSQPRRARLSLLPCSLDSTCMRPLLLPQVPSSHGEPAGAWKAQSRMPGAGSWSRMLSGSPLWQRCVSWRTCSWSRRALKGRSGRLSGPAC